MIKGINLANISIISQYYMPYFKDSFKYVELVLAIRSVCVKTEDEILEKIVELNIGEPNIDTAELLYSMTVYGIEFEKININTATLYKSARMLGLAQEEIVKYINGLKDKH